MLDQENLRRLTAEFEINFENELKFNNYADIKRSGRKMGLSYGKPKPLAARLTNDNLFVMEGMPIPSMHVAKSKVEEIRWVCNQISGIEHCYAGYWRKIIYLLTTKKMKGSIYLVT